MKYIVKTLIDITETRSRFDNENISWKQQQNYQTVLNTVGLRCNAVPLCAPTVEETTGVSVGFGTRYRTNNKVWTWQFEIPYGETSIELLTKDFHMVPIIIGLTETASITVPVFDTQDEKNKNIVFSETL